MSMYFVDLVEYETHLESAQASSMELHLYSVRLSSIFRDVSAVMRDSRLQSSVENVWNNEIARYTHATPDRSDRAVSVAGEVLRLLKESERLMVEYSQQEHSEHTWDLSLAEQAQERRDRADEISESANDFDEEMYEVEDRFRLGD